MSAPLAHPVYLSLSGLMSVMSLDGILSLNILEKQLNYLLNYNIA